MSPPSWVSLLLGHHRAPSWDLCALYMVVYLCQSQYVIIEYKLKDLRQMKTNKQFLLTKRACIFKQMLRVVYQFLSSYGRGCSMWGDVAWKKKNPHPHIFQPQSPLSSTAKLPVLPSEPPHSLPSHHTWYFHIFVILFTPFFCSMSFSNHPC